MNKPLKVVTILVSLIVLSACRGGHGGGGKLMVGMAAFEVTVTR